MEKQKTYNLRIDNLKKIKEKSGKVNIEIAQEIGVRESTVCNWLNGKNVENIRYSSTRLIDIFIQNNQRYLS